MTLPFSNMQALEAVAHPNGLETRETANVLVCLFCAQTETELPGNHKPFFSNVFVKTRVFETRPRSAAERGRCAAERRTRLLVRVSVGAAGGS